MSEADLPKPVRADLFSGPTTQLDSIGLAGSRCGECGETTLGANALCPNCSSEDMTDIRLSDDGSVWSYTVVRYRPPGNYKGGDPFQPFAMALVDLPEGIRVVAPIAGDPDAVKIGMPVRFRPVLRTDNVVEFDYRPVEQA